MIKKFKIFEINKIERHESAVQELKEDLLHIFKDEISKRSKRVTTLAIDRLFDSVQSEFNRGEEPKVYITYKEGVNLIIEIPKKSGPGTGLSGPTGFREVRGELICLVEAYGKAHAEVLSAIESGNFLLLTDDCYKSVEISSEQVSKKVADLKQELSIWENIL